MRTTLDIDPIVLAYAKGAAKHRRTSVGEVISELALDGLKQAQNSNVTYQTKNGFPQISRGPDSKLVITNEYIQALLEDSE